MSLSPPSRNALPFPLAFLSFDAALFLVSDCLTEARLARDINALGDEANWYKAAEVCALQTGYLELLRLVWGETNNFPGIKRASRRKRAARRFGRS